jgi:predicted MPP superfamily phosphohydrolase
MFWLMLFPICILMFFYVTWRFFVIFWSESKLIPLIISAIITILTLWTFMYQWDSKILDILWTIGTWIFVLGFLLMIFLFIENIIHIWYKINPRIFLWVIVIIFWLWTYFSLHTKIKNLNIETDKIENDVKILLVSDIHTENVTQDFHVNKIIKTIEKEKPDFVIIAWDLMNKPNYGYIDYLKPFKSVKDTPIFAVEWNHDVMWNTTIVQNIPDKSGIKILNNESVKIAWIQVIWIIDKSLRWNSVEQTMNQVEFDDNQDLFNILVTHQPIWLDKLTDYPIDLEVAGHTHRGQFYWMRKVVEWMNDYAYWEYKLWDRTAFVTQWIWTWWLPFRLWTQSEMVIINLIKK